MSEEKEYEGAVPFIAMMITTVCYVIGFFDFETTIILLIVAYAVLQILLKGQRKKINTN